ncbi:hypothetical protein [uncultured Methanobrevibacter sp.]|uniref:hypothetical protein n=1 Tax=uncultured Methanobrevibacter sp. TaxID=253161 RepID=UPI00262F6FA7|nr:hypothetical protein [uncultured Methanobrevibacter sp.]
MEFILDHKKYSILNHELYINYLIVDSYFRENQSLYEYDIKFDFITPLLEKEKVEFEDILEGTQVLEELIEKEEISFIPYGLKIDQHVNETFRISYQDCEFANVNVGEAIPLIIALNTLLTYKPTVPMFQIEEELNHFLERFRSYGSE